MMKRYLTLSSLLACLVLLAGLRFSQAQPMVTRSESVAATPRPAIANRAVASDIQSSSPVMFPENTKPTPTSTSTSTLTAFSPRPTPTPVALFLYLPMILRSPLPDLTVNSMGITLETGGDCNYTSTQLGVRVWFQNIGSADAGPFVVEVNGAQQTVTSGLHTGQTDTLWFPEYVYPGENTAFVDASFQLTESNENNNQLSQFLPIPTLPPTCTPTPTPTASD
jgi:hypothetical protein